MNDIVYALKQMGDAEYAAFSAKIIPETDPALIIGVRTPELRAYAKKIRNMPEAEAFMKELPHTYFEEDQLHSFLISGIRDFDTCIARIQEFLPYISCWATCDQMNSTALKKQPERLLEYAYEWMESDHTYTVRFGILTLMRYFLDERFDVSYAQRVSEIRSDNYYVKMMTAWYFATALAKQYDAILPFIEERKLEQWVHNKTIQKAVESNRISDEQKTYLRSLKWKKGE